MAKTGATLQELLKAAYRSWSGRLRATAHVYFADPDLVDAVIHEAYLSVIRSAPPCRTPKKALGYWKAAIRSRSIDRLRAAGRLVGRDEPELEAAAAATMSATASPEEQYIERETAERRALALHAALAKLPPKQRQAVELHEFLGMTFEQIGKKRGVPRSTPYRRFKRACERLAVILRVANPDLWPAGPSRRGAQKSDAKAQHPSPPFVQYVEAGDAANDDRWQRASPP